jgi:L-lysine 2,3-aminomutase
VDDARALELVHGLRVQLPGYLVPKLVREVGGEVSKRPL